MTTILVIAAVLLVIPVLTIVAQGVQWLQHKRHNESFGWWYVINDNQNPVTKRKGSILRGGRVILHVNGASLEFSWSLLRHFCHIGVTVGGCDDDLTFELAVPGIAVWFSGENVLPRKWRPDDPHRTGIDIHDWAIWFNIWQNDMEWDPKRDRFRHFNFNFNIPDFFLGSTNYSKRNLKTDWAPIPMPEGSYPAKITIHEDTWKRPRWPFPKRIVRATIDMEKPIPFPGKGENAWDCGDDALHSLTTPATTIPKAIAATVESVLQSRMKRGGGLTWKTAEKAVGD